MPKGKDRTVALKVAVSVVLAACFGIVLDYLEDSSRLSEGLSSTILPHLVGQLLHANLFHLLANVYVLWLLRFSPRELLAAYLLSIPATFFVWEGTVVGFSSVLYVLMGMRMPQTRMPKAGWAVFIAANLATAFAPGIAFGVHCAAFALGWIFVKVKRLSDEYRGTCKRRRT